MKMWIVLYIEEEECVDTTTVLAVCETKTVALDIAKRHRLSELTKEGVKITQKVINKVTGHLRQIQGEEADHYVIREIEINTPLWIKDFNYYRS